MLGSQGAAQHGTGQLNQIEELTTAHRFGSLVLWTRTLATATADRLRAAGKRLAAWAANRTSFAAPPSDCSESPRTIDRPRPESPASRRGRCPCARASP